MLHATVWIGLKGIMQSEKSQSQKATYYMIPFIQHSPPDQNIELEHRLVVRGEMVSGGKGEHVILKG